jgi:hypothetical protein
MRTSGIKSFGTRRPGKIVLVVLAIAIIAPTFLFLGPLIAIPAVLIFTIGLPIYLGWKIPRQLGLAGLVVLLVSAPVAAAGDAALLVVPSPPFSSSPAYPFGNGNGSVLADAQVSPYQAAPGSMFTFTVKFQPQYLPANYTPVYRVLFYMSSCPGATGNTSTSCASGYPHYWNNTTVQNPTTPQTFTFSHAVTGVNIWTWQIGVSANNSTGKPVWIFLDTGGGFGTIQGPLTGSTLEIFAYLLLPSFLEQALFYGGLSLGFGLLAYVFFKTRERRRAEARQAAEVASRVPTIESGGGPPKEAAGPPMGKPPAALAPPPERSCPNCQAVVYLNESTCWKCGAPLAGSGSDAPLPSDH